MPARRTETPRRPRQPTASRWKRSSASAAQPPIVRNILARTPSRITHHASVSQQPPIVRDILARTRTAGFQRYLRDLLVELCQIDTTPNAKVKRMQAAEDSSFRILERELRGLNFPGARLERRPVNPAIQTHPNYSLLHFTRTPQRPEGLSPQEAYAGRSNLLYVVPGASGSDAGQSVAVNAHIDVVAPYFPPRVKGGTVFGRGACDDKGPAVSLIAALKVLSEAMPGAGLQWNRNVVAMLVVEKEPGMATTFRFHCS